ncbi:MAG: type II toxin-antitoxin system RatA family toxin [Gammaproteobacteria bacterium]|nr:type II toxin-antitoxin system RatA family toxin [Gammaproteobacteria bacterium]
MPIHSGSRILPYSCEQLFDLATDVESYPEYLPGWVDARVLEQSGNTLRVEQRLGLKILPLPFVTTAVLDRPHTIRIHSSSGPFRFLQVEWCFEPADAGNCAVFLEFNFILRNRFIERVTTALFEQLSPEIINRFEKRAELLYRN